MAREPSKPGHVSGQHPSLPEITGYRLQRVLGHGGMSTVYLARQVSLEREVALKVMLPEALTDEISRRRFENEARTIARLDHPNIVSIFEVGRSRDGLPYYAMPYLARGHLGQREFAHDQERIRSILHALLSALDYAHGRGVVHRDVKAENVLFDDAERPMLADFGIALRRGYGTRVTTAGLAVGSTAYMPPEQARGHNVDGRADLYSVGVLGWEMLTGRLPYNAGDALSMALQHAQEPIPRLPPELGHWQRFFDKALAKTPEARFASARDMRAALDRVPERAPTSWLAARLAGQRWRLPLAWTAIALALVAAVGLLGYRQFGTGGAEAMDTPAGADGEPPATGGAANLPADDALDALMRPLPESPAERLLATADIQIRQERWTTPAGDNAYESIVAAAEADAHHPRLQATTGRLIDAIAERAARSVRAGELAAATRSMQQARTLAERAGLPAGPRDAASPPIARMEQALADALRARADAAGLMGAERRQGLLADARRLQLGAERIRALQASAPAGGAASATPEPGWTQLRSGVGDRRMLIADSPVTRADYARFAQATNRETTLCRDRGSLLRILAPRDWKSPGFEQTPRQPVVCVSWQDAHAYARWLGERDGRRYRLASVDEVHAAPASGDRLVATWADACGEGGCTQRIAAGRGWRGGANDRALESDRGYDDVGIRLVRER